MTLTPQLRKAVLTAHIACSVGWLGAVATSVALAVAGLVSQDGQVVRSAYLALEVLVRFVLVPFSLAALFTGLVQSLGTPWGLFRHYWVVVKLLINLGSIAVLLAYLQTLSALADVAAQTPAGGDLARLRSPSPVVHAGAALLLLVVATVLSVYKPRGVTPYGWRQQQVRRAQRSQE